MKLPTAALFPGTVLGCEKARSVTEPIQAGELRDSHELSEASLGQAFLRDRPRWWNCELSGLNSRNAAECLPRLGEIRARKDAAG